MHAYLQSNPDGILLSGLTHSPQVERMLAGSRMPVVSMMDLSDDPAGLSVGFSQHEAGHAVMMLHLGMKLIRIESAGATWDRA